MRLAKTMTPALAAASLLLALAGSTSASATVLCRNNANTMTCSEKYETETELHLVAKSGFKIKPERAEMKTAECGTNTWNVRVKNAGSSTSTVSGLIETQTFTNCNCALWIFQSGSIEVHYISGTDNGTVTSSGWEITTDCQTIFGSEHCVYKTSNTDLGTLTGGNPSVLVVNASLPHETENPFCNAHLEAEYEVTSPKPLYVAAG